MSGHISSQFNMELENIRTHVLQMGGMVEEQISTTLEALLKADSEALAKVSESDSKINEMEIKIDEECLLIIARRQPTAGDLRMVMAVSRVIVDLERVGDEIKKIADSASHLIENNRVLPERWYPIHHLLSMAQSMLKRSLDAFARLDISAVVELAQEDTLLDKEYANQLRTLITYMMEDARTISSSIDLMFMKKNIERIGDHAKNISEHVVYLAKGVDVRHTPPEEIQQVVEDD